MGKGWRASLRAIVLVSAGVAAAVVTVHGAHVSAAAGGSPAARVSPAAIEPVPTHVTLPSVTVHPLDPSVVAAASAAPRSQSATQTIQLTVLGGPLELVTHEATAALEPVAGSTRDWVGVLPPVRVIDARGTHEGWSVSWAVDSVGLVGDGGRGSDGSRVMLEPGEPMVVHGTSDGLHAGGAASATPNGRPLFSADEGSGGGTYEAGGSVSLRLPAGVDADSVVVKLAFSLG